MSARDDAYDTIRARLTSGFYRSGDTLIPGALSGEFNVSRTPVREALGLLERDGLLRSTSRGFTPYTRSDEEVQEIFEVRGVLDSAAAEAAAARRTDTDLLHLRELGDLARSVADVAERRRLLNRWHDALRSAAHNATISSLLHTLDAHVKLAAPWQPEDESSSRPIAERLDEHDAITAAVADRDGERARTLMLEHLRHDQNVRIRQRARRKELGR